MATTTANISISSSDLIPGMAMNYYKSSTLHKAGSCTGLSRIQSGTKDYSSTSTVVLLDQSVLVTDTSTVTANKANKLYIKNLSTDTTEYFTITINSEELGRLYAGDWMFIPWSAEDSGADVKVTPSVATSMKLEYVLVHE
tara:strand:- start:1 stop:423 length:423 start_codon:yes stop_codon:yes gene_type:complete